MKRIRSILKKNYKLLIAFLLGLIVSGTTVYAAILHNSNEVSYNNRTSGLSSTTVQDAIDEINNVCNSRCPEGYTCTPIQ